MEKSFGARLDALRKGASFDEFGKLVGLPGEVVRKHCKGISEPKAGQICRYSVALGVSADYLLGLPHAGGGDAISAFGNGVAAKNSTVNADVSAEVSRLLGIIESQQRVIENLSRSPHAGSRQSASGAGEAKGGVA